ncbi:MAG: HD domain-containing protein [Deltaproteobacteria bacterium]|nr:HD domain-containing protein [Deltaproteobacteria bacterium]
MKCPGQDSRYWKPGAIFESRCPQCGNEVEFFKDDTTRRCRKCGHRFLNPAMDFGCASYCKFAEQCVGNLPPELIAQKENLLKDRVAIEMKRYFKKDFKRIGHAGRVARYAEQIAKEEGGDLAVVLTAAYLHDIGIPEAERKHGDAGPVHQEQEGPPVARKILEDLGAREDLIREVCDIIGHHHHPRPEETVNFQAVYDADLIANMEERKKMDPLPPEKLKSSIEEALLTRAGKILARKVLLTPG